MGGGGVRWSGWGGRGAAPTAAGAAAFVTVHPSYLLRLPGEAARRRAFGDFVRDLAAAKALAAD
ncbi:MAG: hypothetical protein ACR2F8_10485 [Caulobacteraceae bacterium]